MVVVKAKERNSLWAQVMSKVYANAQDDMQFVSQVWETKVDNLHGECKKVNNKVRTREDKCCLLVRTEASCESWTAFEKYLLD